MSYLACDRFREGVETVSVETEGKTRRPPTTFLPKEFNRGDKFRLLRALVYCNMTSDAERQLQAALAEGQEAAFVELYDQFADRLYAVAVAVTGSTADAEDAVHDTFLAVWQSRRALARVDNLATYLFASLRRAAVRVVKRRRRLQRAASDAARTASAVAVSPGTNDDLDRAVRNLPDAQREVIALRIDVC